MQPGASAVDRRAAGCGPVASMGLLILSAALFSLSFPNILFPEGVGFLAWVSAAPALWVVGNAPFRWLWLWGPLWGGLSCAGAFYWLGIYHPLGLLLGVVVQGMWYLLLSLGMRSARVVFPKNGVWVQLALWMGWEYLRLQGFLGFPYGNLAYTQYQVPFLRAGAGLWGIWGIGILVVMPSLLLAWVAARREPSGAGSPIRRVAGRLAGQGWFIAAWALLMVAGLAWSCIPRPLADGKKAGMLLVQQDVDPRVGGLRAYRESLDRLERQTLAGLAEHPEADMVVWSETSFVPSVTWHERFRTDPDIFVLVQRLQKLSRDIGRPLVLGNGDGVPTGRSDGSVGRKDYNAVLVMEDGEVTDRYYKSRLVPFTEYFPYGDHFPFLKDLLEEKGADLWNPGGGFTTLRAGDLVMGTPICFEDSFPDISRTFRDAGARVLVNLSNDRWSLSVPGAMQHMAMAVFRAVENNMYMVRSTNAGMTVLIGPDGAVLTSLPPFREGWLWVEAGTEPGPLPPAGYLAEWPGVLLLLAGAGALLAGFAARIFRRFLSGPGRETNR